jgi:nicotinamide-nucleotide amidase
MLDRALKRFTPVRAEPRELGVAGMPESDVQHAAQRALEAYSGIQLTVLAKPGDVRVILLDEGAGETTLITAAHAVADEIGDACYSRDGSSLAEVVIREATHRNLTIATAESCTGGMVAAALTEVPGASAAYLGSAVTYSNASKKRVLDVSPGDLQEHGAVSQQVAQEMARGVQDRFGADICVAITGIAGPAGGTAEKPVGTVWFAVRARRNGRQNAWEHSVSWTGASREGIRSRATAMALDLVRREMLGT